MGLPVSEIEIRWPAPARRVLACMDYAAGYLLGLRRAILGKKVSTPREHVCMLLLDDHVGEGYRDGLAEAPPSPVWSEPSRIP